MASQTSYENKANKCFGHFKNNYKGVSNNYSNVLILKPKEDKMAETKKAANQKVAISRKKRSKN